MPAGFETLANHRRRRQQRIHPSRVQTRDAEPRVHVAGREPLLDGTNFFQGHGREIDLGDGNTGPFQINDFRQVRGHTGRNHDSIKLRLTKSLQGCANFLLDDFVHGTQFGFRGRRLGQKQIFQANGPQLETHGV